MFQMNVERYHRHYKGGYYERQGVATHSETHEQMVIYKGVCEDPADEKTWVRPLPMWTELVEVDGQQVPRFRPCDASDLGRVLYFTLRCPSCDQVQPLGKYSTADLAFAAMQAKGYCGDCDTEVSSDDSAKDWTEKTEAEYLKPLVARHMAGVRTSLPEEGAES